MDSMTKKQQQPSSPLPTPSISILQSPPQQQLSSSPPQQQQKVNSNVKPAATPGVPTRYAAKIIMNNVSGNDVISAGVTTFSNNNKNVSPNVNTNNNSNNNNTNLCNKRLAIGHDHNSHK